MKLGSTGSIAKNNFIESKLTVAFFLIVFSVTIQIFKFQIRVRILKKKKNTAYPMGYCAGKNIENSCSYGCFIKAMNRIFFYGFTSKSL